MVTASPDILWQNDNGDVAIWLYEWRRMSRVRSHIIGNPGPGWHVIGAEDFDGDGKADIVLQNDNGQAEIWDMNGLTLVHQDVLATNLGPSWHIVV